MKLPPFAYARARSVDEALELLGEAGDDAKLVAGGQSLVPVLAYGLSRPAQLVDIDGIRGLDGILERDDGLELGALVRHSQLEVAHLQGDHRLVSLAARHIGHPPIRTRGTLGGSLAHADPAAELPVATLALEARVVLRSVRGEREVPAHAFALGPFTTATEPDEMVVALRVPRAVPHARAAFREFCLRSGDFALASVGIVVVSDGDGVVRSARIVVGGVEPVPRLLEEAGTALAGARLRVESIATAARTAAAVCEPVVDRDVDEAMRRDLVAALVREALGDIRARVAA